MTESLEIKPDPQPETPAPAPESVPAAVATPAAECTAAPVAAPAAESAPPKPTWLARSRAALAGMMPANQLAFLTPALGFAAGFGLLVGGVASMGIGHLLASPTPTPAAPVKAVSANEVLALQGSVAQIEAKLTHLKASLDASNRRADTQFARLTTRFDKADKAQAEASSKVGKVGEALDRLEHRIATVTHEATGSITPQKTALAEPKQPPTPPVVAGWTLRDVERGRALVEYRHGLYEAAPGLDLPGLGRVESVKRQDGHWVVVTAKGLIVAQAPKAPVGYGRRAYRYND